MKLTTDIPIESFVKIFNQMNHLEYKNFIRHSLQVAKLTRKLVDTLNLPIDLDCAYLAGMLHDLGLVIKASVENYELFVDMFRKVPDLEKIVLTFDKADQHPLLSYKISSLIKPLCPSCAKGILYHHIPYQKIPEADSQAIYLANCIKTADTISLVYMKHEQGEMTVDLLEEMIESVQKSFGILEEIKVTSLEILQDYKLICELLDDENRFNSQKSLTLEEFEHAVRVLATLLDLRSPYTRNHTFVVAKFAKAIALEMMTEEDARLMNIAALLHDLGKLKTPLNILHKKERLDEREFIIMKRHVVDTYRILENSGLTNIAKISASHHERLDGTGYPTGLKEDQTSIYQKIIQVCDVFSALVEHRPYRERMEVKDALSVIEKDVMNKKLDKIVYDKLKELVKNELSTEDLIFRNALEELFGLNFDEIKHTMSFSSTEEG
ncbi:MAG TPA: HD domain-containing phosphohydrolase [Pseudothermotoga sp.]